MSACPPPPFFDIDWNWWWNNWKGWESPHTHSHTLSHTHPHTLTHTQHKMSLRLVPPLHLKSLPLPLWVCFFPSSFLFYFLFCFLSFSFSFFLNISYWFYFLRFMYVYFILFLFNLKQKCHGMLDLLFGIKTFFLGLVWAVSRTF